MGIPVDKTYEWRDLNQRLDSNNMNIILEEDDEEDDSYVEEELSTREYWKRSILIQLPSWNEAPTKRHQGS